MPNTVDFYVSDLDNPRVVVGYLYDDDYGATIKFRAMSSDAILNEEFVFVAVHKPRSYWGMAEFTLPCVVLFTPGYTETF